jgi:hypothetical protein
MRTKSLKNVLTYAVVAGALSGCASQSQNTENWWHGNENISYLTPKSTEKVKFAQPGEVVNVVDMTSQEYEMQVKKRYFSASGKDCLEAQTTQDALVICEYSENRWGISRSFSQFTSEGALQ